MRAAIDTNIWVSSFLDRRGAPAALRAAHRAGRFTVVTSEPLLAELEEVLRRPKFARRGINFEEVRDLLQVLRTGGPLVQVEGALSLCRDPDDDVLIETAITGKADALVSGDHDLAQSLEVVGYLGRANIRVISARRFLEEIEGS